MKLDQSKMPLYDAIRGYIGEDVTLFHIPSHKMGRAIHPDWLEFAGTEIFKMDLSEVSGLDDLHAPQGAILEAQRLAADAWGADESFFLVNGTSGGIIASVCSVAAEGDELIVPRNVHKSVIYGLIVSGATPVYVSADVDRSLGLVCGLSPDAVSETYDLYPDAKGLVCVSPTYHGVCSDVGRLADVTHAHGGILIADEAHGNHTYFHPELPPGALTLGADISCQSTHKMSGSLTQSSILHLGSGRISGRIDGACAVSKCADGMRTGSGCVDRTRTGSGRVDRTRTGSGRVDRTRTGSGRVDRTRLISNLRLIQSTSPSYLLMVSLDMARSHIALRGQEILGKVLELSLSARARIGSLRGMSVLGEEIVGKNHIAALDSIRIVVSAREMGFEGYALSRILRDDYNIEVEFADFYYCVCTMGLGTRAEDVDRLVFALSEISDRYFGLRAPLSWDEALPPLPQALLTPRAAYFGERRDVPWSDAKGEICADMIVPYPPGIPAICPGEIITDEIWDYLNDMRRQKRHIHGFSGENKDRIGIVIPE